jgi:hypothetical protein
LKEEDFVQFTTMDSVTLVHTEEKFTIPVLQAMTKCHLFQNNPTLLVSPYRVQSPVSLSIFREFLSALEGNAINITDTNFTEFHRLCKEFDFSELAAKLSEFRSSMNFNEGETESETEDSDARERIAALEEKSNQHSHVIAILQDKVTQLSTDFWRLVGEVSALRSASAGIQTLSEEVSALKTQITQKLNDPVVEQLSTEFSELRKDVSALKTKPPPSILLPRSSLYFGSVIITTTPTIFAPIGGIRTVLLYRGSRNGFSGKNFHKTCNGHSNTVTIVLTSGGYVFGGYSPCQWDSSLTYKEDKTLKSFLFTLRNPHGVLPTAFPLKKDRKTCAIYCHPSKGPIFGGGPDIIISNECNSNERNHTRSFGDTYQNTTGLDSSTFFNGNKNFTVKEIEVFEIVT